MKRTRLYKITFKNQGFTEDTEKVYASDFDEAYDKAITILKQTDFIERIVKISECGTIMIDDDE